MPFYQTIGKLATRVVSSQCIIQRRLPIPCASSYRCGGSTVNADDLRSLPEKPKKPLTPYFRFMVDMRPEIKKDHPDHKTTELVKVLADKWDKASSETRQKYMDEYKKELVAYSSARTKYELQLTDEQKELLKRAKHEMAAAKENRILRKKMRDLGKPRRPGSAFIIFFNSKVHSRGETPYKDWVRTLAKEWSNLPPELKISYQKEYSTAMENHRRQIQEWEERMIRMGHIDVVRSEALIEPKTASKKVLRTRLVGKNK